jgi:hypothetical protein
MAPSTQQQWRVQGKGNGTFDNLNFNKEAPVPEVGDKDVLVKCESSKYRSPICSKY